MDVRLLGFVSFWLFWLALGPAVATWFLCAKRWRARPDRAALASTFSALGLGIVLIMVILFAPINQGREATSTVQLGDAAVTVEESSTISLGTSGRSASSLQRVLSIVVVLLAGTTSGVTLTLRYRRRFGRALVWSCAGMLLLLTIIGMASIGAVLLPITCLALAAAISTNRQRDQEQARDRARQACP